jgi:hypothetical protein
MNPNPPEAAKVMSVKLKRCSTLLWCAVMAGLLVGCGGDPLAAKRPKVVMVSGIVLHENKPVEGATVMFVPQGHTNAAAGLTDAKGEFQLQTFEANDGAVPGNYKITIRKISLGTAASAGGDDANVGAAQETWLLPKKYGESGTTDLTATVGETGENKFSFKLTGPPGGATGSKPANFRGNG